MPHPPLSRTLRCPIPSALVCPLCPSKLTADVCTPTVTHLLHPWRFELSRLRAPSSQPSQFSFRIGFAGEAVPLCSTRNEPLPCHRLRPCVSPFPLSPNPPAISARSLGSSQAAPSHFLQFPFTISETILSSVKAPPFRLLLYHKPRTSEPGQNTKAVVAALSKIPSPCGRRACASCRAAARRFVCSAAVQQVLRLRYKSAIKGGYPHI